MKTLTFRGHSDDTFGEYNITNSDVDNCASYAPIQCKLVSAEGQMYVIGQYSRANNGCWDIGISPIAEDVPLPNWSMCFFTEDYSTVFRIVVPDDTTLTWYSNMEAIEE